MRTTASTVQALQRLCEAAEIELTRDGKNFVAHTPQLDDFPPLPKSSARALATVVSALRHRPDWEALRDATRYDPGMIQDAVRVPSGLAGWEEDELVRLAITEV